MSSLLAAVHYWALGIGFAGIVARGLALRDMRKDGSRAHLKRLLWADNFWGISAILWIVTGVLRAFGHYEKGSEFYLQSHWFWLKMVLFGAVFVLEIWPMVTFIRWRIQRKTEISGKDRAQLGALSTVNSIEIALLLIIPIVASIMARGGLR